MLETFKTQYESGKTLSKSKSYHQHSPEVTKIYNELFPLALDYYHELNPSFLFKVSRLDQLKQYPALTVRDGSASFGSFILRNFQALPGLKTHLSIHPKLARLVPTNLRSQFSSWTIVQTKRIEISQAKRILILGLMSDQILPSLEKIKEQLQVLTTLKKDCQIDLYIPTRGNPFSLVWKESHFAYEVVEMIKSFLPHTKLNFFNHRDLFEPASWQDVYCLDLMTYDLAITDSYLNHYLASRGATISSYSAQEAKESFFEVDLHFNHKIQYTPLPQVESIFPAMIFYKKQTTRDYATDPVFHTLLRENDFQLP
ncbi:MAG: hypothetical protein H0V66_10410 [Bdellovibrionales bacterium]|nr:hypothetical protein [Bdellovibrionales bacterium]